MSAWTHIHASVVVDFADASHWEIEGFFQRMKDAEYTLSYDPRKKGDGFEITGSEINATVSLVRFSDYELSPRNRYRQSNVWGIHIFGNLRDRRIDETVAEWNRFGWKLAWYLKELSRRGVRGDDGVCNDDPSILRYCVDIDNEDVRYHRDSDGDMKPWKRKKGRGERWF